MQYFTVVSLVRTQKGVVRCLRFFLLLGVCASCGQQIRLTQYMYDSRRRTTLPPPPTPNPKTPLSSQPLLCAGSSISINPPRSCVQVHHSILPSTLRHLAVLPLHSKNHTFSSPAISYAPVYHTTLPPSARNLKTPTPTRASKCRDTPQLLRDEHTLESEERREGNGVRNHATHLRPDARRTPRFARRMKQKQRRGV
ncbi:uncharacterized protein M421DRAFT_156713 [Didymella exigua CBS 183.55]|uniref:Uncharacterized protein n=1 Tax=Didymella exigua CBS 183.55 TaxID=1150837 RepID=A0A6A5RM85_9PLEO|nr:uncharacterized protein M421DRAFT_156713 [Didymella exigua CBS 183.55]KAF1928228.1 hypothetical protein M421DRAFT_156713 [Didymella exigua CBS 183.55]